MASSKTATFEKVLQATDLDSVDLPLLCLVYERFASVADRDRVESSKADKKSSTPALVTKTWTFVDTQLSSFPPALRGLAQDRIGSNWQQRRDLLVNYEEDSFCKIKIDKTGVLSMEYPQWPPYFLMMGRYVDVSGCVSTESLFIGGHRLFGPVSRDDKTCPGSISVTLKATSLPFKTSAEVAEFLEFTMVRMITAKSLPGTKAVANLEKELAKKSEELAKESQDLQKCSAELQQLSSTVIKCATRLRKTAVVGADRLPKDHRKNAAAAIEGAVTTACELLGNQKDIADEALRAKLQSLKLSNDQLTEDLDRAGAQLDDAHAQVNQLDNEVTRLKEELVEQMECQYCRVNKVDTAFACGHVCCNDCAENFGNRTVPFSVVHGTKYVENGTEYGPFAAGAVYRAVEYGTECGARWSVRHVVRYGDGQYGTKHGTETVLTARSTPEDFAVPYCAGQLNAVNEHGQTYRGCPTWCVGTRSGKPVRHTFKLYF
ncbi:hypothetical protein AAVH_13571 [Aphelenchoides avenae]|nr:hypothetical protein AAVH_13571 [Aphelenchus avenae]